MDRRKFLTNSMLGAASIAATTSGASLLTSCAPAEKKIETAPAPELRLSFQGGIAPGESLNEKLDYMESLGIVGFEPGGGDLPVKTPFPQHIGQRLTGHNPGNGSFHLPANFFGGVGFTVGQNLFIGLS